MLSPIENEGNHQKKPQITIEIPIDKEGSSVGVTKEDLSLICRIVSFANLLSADSRKTPPPSVETLKERINQLRLHLPSPQEPQEPETLSARDRVFAIYQKHLEQAMETIMSLGEERLKVPSRRLLTGFNRALTEWENLVGTLNLVSRWLLTQRTGINCVERNQEGRFKPVEIVQNLP